MFMCPLRVRKQVDWTSKQKGTNHMVQKWERVGDPTDLTEKKFGKKMIKQMIRDPDGKLHEFVFYHLNDSCVVLVVTTADTVIAVREYKQGADRVEDGLVGGYCNEGENFEDAARREVLEETGYQVGTLISLGRMPVVARHCTAYVNLFLALDCTKVAEQALDEAEGTVEVVEYTVLKWVGHVTTHETDGFSTTATMRALPHLRLAIRP